jgi:hypothetical protein
LLNALLQELLHQIVVRSPFGKFKKNVGSLFLVVLGLLSAEYHLGKRKPVPSCKISVGRHRKDHTLFSKIFCQGKHCGPPEPPHSDYRDKKM